MNKETFYQLYNFASGHILEIEKISWVTCDSKLDKKIPHLFMIKNLQVSDKMDKAAIIEKRYLFNYIIKSRY